VTNRKPQAHVHKLIAETAQGMAHELYDTMMSDNTWYSLWKSWHPDANAAQLEAAFVAKNWARLIPAARAILAGMLAQPINDVLKQTIYDALLLDNTLKRGRNRPMQLQ
jgi:hypothetical protein